MSSKSPRSHKRKSPEENNTTPSKKELTDRPVEINLENNSDNLGTMKKLPKLSIVIADDVRELKSSTFVPVIQSTEEMTKETVSGQIKSEQSVHKIQVAKESPVRKLIEHLRELIRIKSPIVLSIRYPEVLMSALEDLDRVIEMTDVKISILQQVQFLIVSQAQKMSLPVNEREKNGKFNGHMLHTVIAGPAGCGKTKIGVILAKIWMAIGLVAMPNPEGNRQPSPPRSGLMEKIIEAVYVHRLIELRSQLSGCQKKLREIHEVSLKHRTDLRRLRHQLVQMRSNSKALPLDWNTVLTELQGIRMGLNSVLKNSRPEDLDGSNGTEPFEDETDDTLNPEPDDSNFEGNCGVDNCQEPSSSGELLITNLQTSAPILTTASNDPPNETIIRIRVKDGSVVASEPLTGSKSSATSPPNQPIPKLIMLTADNSGVNKTPENNGSPPAVPITIVSRNDFVAEYVGQTAIKTVNLLKANLGKVLFIDEAYSLINGERDTFGMEALTTLNKFMSEHPNDIIIIFAGYRDLMQETIFKSQPGLRRRCTWVFDVKGYSPEGLAKIFAQQVAERGYDLDLSDVPSSDSPEAISVTVRTDHEKENLRNLVSFFENHKDHFKSFGGDTERLAFYCGLAYAESKFDGTYKNIISGKMTTLDNKITKKMLDKALALLMANNAESGMNMDDYKIMYS